MKKNINKKLILSITSVVASFSIAPGIALVALNSNNSNSLTNNQNNTQNGIDQKADTKPITKTARNPYNANLVSKNGPITFWNDTIASLDWFGSQRWSLDLTQVTFQSNGKTITPFKDRYVNWKRTWLNWDIDRTNNILYVLSNGSDKGKTQYVVSIDINNGKPLNYWETEGTIVGQTTAYYGISVLSGGKQVAAYMRGATNSFEPQTDIIDVSNPDNHKGVKKTGNIKNMSSKPETAYVKEGSFNYFFNFIPIGNDLNLVTTYNFNSKGGSAAAGTDGLKEWMTAEIRFILCDNNMNKITTANSRWQKDILALNPITGVKNSATMPQRDFYTLLDGRVVTVIYDSMIIIDGTNRNNPTFTTYKLEPDKWIESWSLDTNENLFYKVKDTSEIKKLVLDKTGGNNHTNSTYYDLSGSSYQEVKDNAANYTLYNVYGYSGQIMLLNSWYWAYVNADQYPKPDEITSKQYGLAVAITTHKNNTEQGDTYGLLNGDKSILKSADFTIEENILKSKLPSEFRKSDITYLNNGFLTNNDTKDNNGQLKYPPFTKTLIDDQNKKLKLSLYLDQIPWFVKNNEMPKDIAPIKIEKEFTFDTDIKSRFLWKPIETDYDFKNTLPKKVTLDEIKAYAPFVSTLNSQNATIGKETYPQINYSIGNTNNATGEIEIKVEYKYLPWEVTANVNNLKTYTDSKTYKIFSDTTPKAFVFAGDSDSAKEYDVSKIPELKEIKEANVLPSDFKNAAKKDFEKFINTEKTKGYPLGKMDITATPDDANGTLTISIDPKKYDNTLQVVTKKFTGLNKKSNYSFSINDGISSFNKSSYLPSEITNDMFYNNFVNSTGFDQSDFNVTSTPDDINGKLTVSVILSSNYSSGVLANTDFKQDGNVWVARRTIEGFMNADTRNKQYSIEFKESTDSSLTEIQKLTPNTIKSKLGEGGLTVGNATYKNEKELIDLFIKSRGVNIPTSIGSYNNAKVSLTVDDSKGELKFTLKLTGLTGRDTPIDYMATIDGFVQGTEVNTKDTISFKNNAKLLADYPDLFSNTANEFKDKFLADSKTYLNQILLIEPTGGYKQAIDNNQYEVSINAIENDGIVNIVFKFKPSDTVVFDPLSALEVSCQYSGFAIK